MPNLGKKINAHNLKIIKNSSPEVENEESCKCTKFECPVEGQCTQKGVVYHAKVERGDGKTDHYVGLTENTFKQRWSTHNSSFRTRNPKNKCGLSEHIWDLQDRNISYNITWEILSKANPFNPVTGVCNLCNREKYFILFKPEIANLNKREEIVGPCLHKRGKLLVNS